MTDKRYTDEQRAEIRAAVVAQVDAFAVPWKGEAVAAGVLFRLDRPAIHPDVPVLLTYENGDIHVSCSSEARTASDTVRVDVLIPVPEAREIARRKLTRYVDGDVSYAEALAEVDRDLDAYTRGESS